MSLQDLIILQDKCDELGEKLAKLEKDNWKKAYEEEAQDHIATSINLQKLIKELEEKLDVAIEAIQFARMVLSDAKLTGAVDDMNNYLKEIGENK